MLKTSIRYFNTVVQHGSIRAAADHLAIAQSAVSRQLQALEHELGVLLFERRARGVVLTQAGELLYACVRDVSFSYQRLQSELDALQGLRRGHIRIHTIESLIQHLVPTAVDRFRSQFPGITFEMIVTGSDQIAAAVRRGDTDIGLAFRPPSHPEVKVEFRSRERLSALVPRSHALAVHKQISVGDLIAWPVAVPTSATGSRVLFDEACREANVEIFPALQSNSVELLHRFALMGDGVAILNRLCCLDDIAAKRLVVVPFKESAMNAGFIEVLTLSSRKLPVAAERFLIFLKREIDALPP